MYDCEQGLNCLVVTLLVGLIRYVDPALQTLELNGQHPQSPWQGQVDDVQSCIAPIMADISTILLSGQAVPGFLTKSMANFMCNNFPFFSGDYIKYKYGLCSTLYQQATYLTIHQSRIRIRLYHLDVIV